MPGCRAGPSCRVVSPSGGSILMTSAPRSPRVWAARGPRTTVVESRTRIPVSGPDMAALYGNERRATVRARGLAPPRSMLTRGCSMATERTQKLQDSRTQKLQDSRTQKLQDSRTQKLQDSRTQKLQDKVVVVTGASRGIGADIARLFADEGGRIICAARTLREGEHPLAGSLETTVAAIRQAGGEATPVTANISEPEECERLIRTAREIYGPVDVLVNNAALTYYIPIKDYPVNRWVRSWAVNLHAPFILSKLVLEDMIPRERGASSTSPRARQSGRDAGHIATRPPFAAAPATARRRPRWSASPRGWPRRCTRTASP